MIAIGSPPPQQPADPGIASSNMIAIGSPPPQQPADPGIVAPPTSAVAISAQEVADVRAARWQAWDQLAAGRPDGYLLSVELLHSRIDQAFSVFTVVRGGRAVQLIVGAAPTTAALASEDPASADAVALGEPPPKGTPEPGIVAQGNSLLTAAFGAEVLSTSTPSR